MPAYLTGKSAKDIRQTRNVLPIKTGRDRMKTKHNKYKEMVMVQSERDVCVAAVYFLTLNS